MNNDVHNDKNSEKPKSEKKFIQISPESIELIADSAGYPNVPTIISKSLAEDTSYRLRELIQVKVDIMFFINQISFQLVGSLELQSNPAPQ